MSTERALKKILAFAGLIIIASYAHAQSVYTYDVKKDIIIGTLSLGVFLSPFFVDNSPDQPPLSSPDKSGVNGFDRPLMFSYNRAMDAVSDYGVYGMLVLPCLSVLDNFNADTLLTYGIMYGQAFLFTFGTKDLLKSSVIRYRPYVYAGAIPAGKEDDYHNSFPSGSTSLAFLSATFLSTTFSQEYPESKWKLPVIIGSYTLAAGVATMRIASGSHFLSDVITGAAIGSFYGWIIPFLHKERNENFALYFTGNGFLASLKY